MERSLKDLLALYNPADALENAWMIPAPWYLDPRIAALEHEAVFGRNWIAAGRLDQVEEKGGFFTTELAGEPLIVARGEDGALRAFFNVCRHHAAAVVTEPQGRAAQFRCPYHGWTYGTDGALKGVPEFDGVRDFDRAKNGLLPARVETWENLVFVNLDPRAESLRASLGDVPKLVEPLHLASLQFFERKTYTLKCNWKVYVDNYLDGGYHVPHLHRGLSSVINYTHYTIENFERACLQSSPLSADISSDAATAATRRGRAFYLWIYPNFMINAYAGVMDTNLVLPLGTDRCAVVFDFCFAKTDASAAPHNRESIAVSDRVQDEDAAICEAVQRGLASRAYGAGRLSVRREAGEHLFHRLLHADLVRALAKPAAAG